MFAGVGFMHSDFSASRIMRQIQLFLNYCGFKLYQLKMNNAIENGALLPRNT